jgi:hypothetical protein
MRYCSALWREDKLPKNAARLGAHLVWPQRHSAGSGPQERPASSGKPPKTSQQASRNRSGPLFGPFASSRVSKGNQVCWVEEDR